MWLKVWLNFLTVLFFIFVPFYIVKREKGLFLFKRNDIVSVFLFWFSLFVAGFSLGKNHKWIILSNLGKVPLASPFETSHFVKHQGFLQLRVSRQQRDEKKDPLLNLLPTTHRLLPPPPFFSPLLIPLLIPLLWIIKKEMRKNKELSEF